MSQGQAHLPEGHRWIPGFEGHFSATEDTIWNHKKRVTKYTDGQPVPVEPTLTGRGYLLIHITRPGNSFTGQIGRALLMAWRGLPDRYLECDHIDRNPLNNHISNLRWATHKENIANQSPRKRQPEPIHITP